MSRPKFKDDEPVVCDRCLKFIVAGHDYLLYENNTFCGEECLGSYLVDNTDYEEKHLNTKEDYEDIYGDMQYEERKEYE